MTYYGKEERRFARGVAGWTLIALAFLLVVGGALWLLGVGTANVKGRGGAYKQKVSAVNRVQKQEQFEQLAADFDGYAVKIRLAKRAVSEATGVDKQLRSTELVGLRQTCVDAAQQFNAESRKYSSRDWKSAGLPARLDPEECAA